LKYGSESFTNLDKFKQIELNGIGKYPHLLVENDGFLNDELTVNFGTVKFGQTSARTITLVNVTEVIYLSS
jgi:hypothetical protein